jgi:tRNA(fMet)-specific endonuclease VapC
MFLLDTDHIGIIQQQTQPEFSRLLQRMNQHQVGDFFFPIISFHEQVLGWNTYINQARASSGVIRGYLMFQQILADFGAAQVLPFDQAAANSFDSLRAHRIRVGTMDLRIAAIALSRNMTVLTRNVRDFQKVPGLNVEDWTV